MPRKRMQREPCDCTDCRNTFPADSAVGTADVRYSHLDAAVESGCTGILALRKDTGNGLQESQIALQNLFCPFHAVRRAESKGSTERGSPLRNIDCEFAGSNEALKDWAKRSGFNAAHSLPQTLGSAAGIHDVVSLVAHRLGLEALHRQCQQAGTSSGDDGSDDDSADLLFLCMDSPPSDQRCQQPASDEASKSGIQNVGSQFLHPKEAAQSSSRLRLEAVDRLLQALNRQPGFRDAVLLVILLGVENHGGRAIPAVGGESLQEFQGVEGYQGITRPRQSFEFSALDEVTVDSTRALLSIQRLPYVIRKDAEVRMPSTLEGFQPGNGCMLAEGLLPEIAYKLGKAPKYGA